MFKQKPVLVVGGAGYIGSHMCKCLAGAGYFPVTLDSLVYGHAEAVKWGPLIRGQMDDPDLLDRLFSDYRFTAVMHFAAFTYVGESMEAPGKYYRNNLAATLSLLEAMVRHDVCRLIFSSTCAVYGEPERLPLTEDHPKNPINVYGRTKLMAEQMLADFGRAHGLRSVCLRYFNAAGADPGGELGEDHRPETHLIPLILDVPLGKRKEILVFGDDYPTPDGTCIRDYIHVTDLAAAHLLALEQLTDGSPGGAYNLGNGAGYSVARVIEAAREVTGHPIPARVVDRRPGDPPELTGSSGKAVSELGWTPRHPDLGGIVRTAWDWARRHPEGYGAR